MTVVGGAKRLLLCMGHSGRGLRAVGVASTLWAWLALQAGLKGYLYYAQWVGLKGCGRGLRSITAKDGTQGAWLEACGRGFREGVELKG